MSFVKQYKILFYFILKLSSLTRTSSLNILRCGKPNTSNVNYKSLIYKSYPWPASFTAWVFPPLRIHIYSLTWEALAPITGSLCSSLNGLGLGWAWNWLQVSSVGSRTLTTWAITDTWQGPCCQEAGVRNLQQVWDTGTRMWEVSVPRSVPHVYHFWIA